MLFRNFVIWFVTFMLLPINLLADEVDQLASELLPKDLTPIGMFLGADWVVKTVIVGLLIASVVTWTIWIVKTFEVRILKRHLRNALEVSSSASSLDSIDIQQLSPGCAAFFEQAQKELELSSDLASNDAIKERVESRFLELESTTNQALIQGTGVLATIGATAPFVGLFGTVWGIMNSFIGISHSNTTSLAVVAPGIAEALLATALGLVAAIPAVVLYNYLARQMGAYRAALRHLSMQIVRLVSRDLDRKMQA